MVADLPEIIRRSGMRQSEIAAAVGVTRGAIWFLVQGKRKPSVGLLTRILQVCGATSEECCALLGMPHAPTPALSTRRPAPIVHHRTVRRVRRGRAA